MGQQEAARAATLRPCHAVVGPAQLAYCKEHGGVPLCRTEPLVACSGLQYAQAEQIATKVGVKMA